MFQLFTANCRGFLKSEMKLSTEENVKNFKKQNDRQNPLKIAETCREKV
jgi:hypothetical protein